MKFPLPPLRFEGVVCREPSMDTQVDIKKKFLSRKEAAGLLGVSLSSIVRGLEKGEIPHVKIGGRILIPAEFVDRLAAKALQREGA